MTDVLNLRTHSGALTDPLYIGRGSKWGNPFVIGKDGDRAAVIAKYRRYLWQKKELMAALPELRGKQLMCFCAPLPCHGHVLVAALGWHDEQVEAGIAERAANTISPEAERQLAIETAKRASPPRRPAKRGGPAIQPSRDQLIDRNLAAGLGGIEL